MLQCKKNVKQLLNKTNEAVIILKRYHLGDIHSRYRILAQTVGLNNGKYYRYYGRKRYRILSNVNVIPY